MIDDYIPGPVTSVFGQVIAGTITGVSPHDWWADTNGLFHTDTDLAAEWKGFLVQAQAGQNLTAIQHLEANAEVVFENTTLATLSADVQARDREDVQREFDAIGAAMTTLGMAGTTPFTSQDYLAIGQTIQSGVVLQELAIQGHGLNSPPLARYNGYTNDFQNGVDGKTLFVGAGLDSNQNALTNFFDDVVLGHLPFPVINQNGHLEQLNQNANSEDLLAPTVGAMDDAAFWKLYAAKDFSLTPGTASATPDLPPNAGLVAGKTTLLTVEGALVANKVTIDTGLTAAHSWAADSSGLFHTNTNLANEWTGYYRTMLAGNGASLTAVQRAEGNAEAVFENTTLATAVTNSAMSKEYREDVQRELDAVASAAMAIGWDGKSDLTSTTYLQLEHALQNNPVWLELALQGHGLNSPSMPRYNGFTNDFQNLDDNTLYLGAGYYSGETAVGALLDDSILTHLPFPTVMQNGEVQQLNQNGGAEATLPEAVDALNQSWLHSVYKKADFGLPGGGTSAVRGDFVGLFGDDIAKTLKANGHTWAAGTDGVFHTGTDLAAEWVKYYRAMLAGKGNTLTALQRWEGNAEAVFENTGLANQSAANLARDREDVQRVIDATGQAMITLGLTGFNLLSSTDYLGIEHTLEANPALRELAMQGQGLNNPSMARYNGFTNDFMSADWQTNFVGGGLDNGQNALSAFFDDQVLGEHGSAVIAQNGKLVQLDQNGSADGTLDQRVTMMNATLYQQVYVAADFSANKMAVGPMMWVPGAQALVVAAPAVAGPGQMTTLFGDIVSTTQVLNGHTWVADSIGLYHTTTDLTLEWYNLYQRLLAGDTTLTGLQWLEANAEAVFENTGLANISERNQERDREDFQRELDVIATVEARMGISPTAALSSQQYLAMQHVIALDGALHEMALQGHGLNSPPAPRYNGYTNDFQNNVDQRTLYVGGGLDTGERAITDLFDDRTISHTLYATVYQNGELVQLNQNGNAENTLSAGVAALNASMFTKVYLASDFVIPGRGPAPALVVPTNTGTESDVFGQEIPGTILANGHSWVSDPNTGLYHTSANLEIEWRTLYQRLLAGDTTLTAVQRLEANAEAVMENTAMLGAYSWTQHSDQVKYREDIQRMLDAVGEAMAANQASFGTDPTQPLTMATYMQLAKAIQGNAAWAELALQGAGMPSPISDRYNGVSNDLLGWGNPLDRTTLYVGGGLDNNQNALTGLLVDGIVGEFLNPVVAQGGTLVQLDNKLALRTTLNQAVVAFDDMAYFHTLHTSDFSASVSSANAGYVSAAQAVVDAAAAAHAPGGSFLDLYGDVIAKHQVVQTGLTNGHVWNADANGLFHTTTDLAAEWKKNYATMTSGRVGSLTIIQRLEGNAEAVFENSGLAKATAPQQVAWREDVQRAIDAMAISLAIEIRAGVMDAKSPFTAASYIALERTLQSNLVANELYDQGHGLSGLAPGAMATRYSGYLGDFRNYDTRTYTTIDFSGAVNSFMDHGIIGNLGFSAGVWNWNSSQLNDTGQREDDLATAISELNLSISGRVFRPADFRK